MKRRKELIVMFGMVTALNIFAQCMTPEFKQICEIIGQDNFFKAEEVYSSNKNDLSEIEQNYTEAILDNAFNRIEESERKIDWILNGKKDLPDSLELQLNIVKGDNALKSYQYAKAGNAYSTILEDYKELLSETETDDFNNLKTLCSALENIPPQTVNIRADTTIRIQKDMGGADTLQVVANNISENFLFDTGANFSVVSKSVAKRFNMDMISVNIDVVGGVNMEFQTQMAVCKKLTLGNIDVCNAVFLAVPDEHLFFPEDNYRIYGVIGYPIIQALKEIRLTKNGEFIVPKQESSFNGVVNLAMDGLLPLIYINGKHFYLDTGAEITTLYHKYYIENQEEIEKKHQLQKVVIGGVGGFLEYDGFIIDAVFSIFGRDVELKGINLLRNTYNADDTTYGNIGQDVISQFDAMTLNLDRMFIILE
ncbi:pepsin/retropepsin-like aspartic protease family protein [Marispirochaeta sp.]|jgi:hypothetical protein|uniref:pepsin/retropepsin-like aspartic protease family protein n=1 Tax=Marispirochaeta sp. TaxID=2038653 RepID=UPI0029C72BCC|nr:pepsin/retropepsin-like aspartic protease family protein [Marispirochaeta sp.]